MSKMSKPEETFAQRKTRLQRELQAMEDDERVIAHLKAKYGEHLLELVETAPSTPISKVPTSAQPQPPVNNSGKSRRAQIIEAVYKYLSQKGERAKTPELMPMLQSLGIELGSDARNTVSAYLSGSDLFDNGRNAGGYGLTEWTAGKRGSLNGQPPREIAK